MPDVYQGTELWQHSLVDPDNRRAVDYSSPSGLAASLASLEDGAAPRTLDEEKLALTSTLLRLRAEHPEAFVGTRSGYRALPVTTGHAFAFARLVDEEAEGVGTVQDNIKLQLRRSSMPVLRSLTWGARRWRL